jgi:hypothetical protein
MVFSLFGCKNTKERNDDVWFFVIITKQPFSALSGLINLSSIWTSKIKTDSGSSIRE